MADPDLRRQVASATIAALPPIPNDTCFSDIAADMADVMLCIVAELVPRSKRPHGAQGWCADPAVQVSQQVSETWIPLGSSYAAFRVLVLERLLSWY